MTDWTERVLPPNADRLKITVCDKPGSGGPSHLHSCIYEVTGLDASTNPAWDGTNQHKVTVLMQNGPVPAGRAANGLTEDALLAVVVDRLRSFQAGAANLYNASALRKCEEALAILHQSAADRSGGLTISGPAATHTAA